MDVRAAAGTLPSPDLSSDKIAIKKTETHLKYKHQMYFPQFSPPMTYYSSYLSVKYMEDFIFKF